MRGVLYGISSMGSYSPNQSRHTVCVSNFDAVFLRVFDRLGCACIVGGGIFFLLYEKRAKNFITAYNMVYYEKQTRKTDGTTCPSFFASFV